MRSTWTSTLHSIYTIYLQPCIYEKITYGMDMYHERQSVIHADGSRSRPQTVSRTPKKAPTHRHNAHNTHNTHTPPPRSKDQQRTKKNENSMAKKKKKHPRKKVSYHDFSLLSPSKNAT